MKKTMFNDNFELTESVLKKRKTRKMYVLPIQPPYKHSELVLSKRSSRCYMNHFYQWQNKENPSEYTGPIKPLYNIGDIVSIAQSYNTIKMEMEQDPFNPIYEKYLKYAKGKDLPGNTNKMLVRCDFMPHHIQITNINIGRLQDITDEGCMQEGIREFTKDGTVTKYSPYDCPWEEMERSPKDAFRKLINATYKKNIWENNPWMWIYEFELID